MNRFDGVLCFASILQVWHLQNLHGCLSAEQLLFYKAHGMESDDRYTVYEEDLYLLISGNCESSMPTNG